jgi:hypothetical protein
MNKEYIEFKRERDLGAIITDAFKFIRLEGKEFFSTILKVAGIPILIAVAAMFYYMTSISSLVSEEANAMLGMFSAMLIMMVAYLVTFVVINLAGMHYIKSYIENNGKVNQEEVTRKTKERFWSFMGFGTLAGIIIFISAFLCFFPAFYTWTVLTLGASILVFENESATDTIGKCFSFISGHFWETFGVIIVVGLLVGILGYVFQIPATIYQFIQMGIGMNSEDPTAVFGLFSDPIYLLLNLVSILGQLMFYAITLVTNVFIYFDINEQKNLTGTIEKIDGLGQ